MCHLANSIIPLPHTISKSLKTCPQDSNGIPTKRHCKLAPGICKYWFYFFSLCLSPDTKSSPVKKFKAWRQHKHKPLIDVIPGPFSVCPKLAIHKSPWLIAGMMSALSNTLCKWRCSHAHFSCRPRSPYWIQNTVHHWLPCSYRCY